MKQTQKKYHQPLKDNPVDFQNLRDKKLWKSNVMGKYGIIIISCLWASPGTYLDTAKKKEGGECLD